MKLIFPLNSIGWLALQVLWKINTPFQVWLVPIFKMVGLRRWMGIIIWLPFNWNVKGADHDPNGGTKVFHCLFFLVNRYWVNKQVWMKDIINNILLQESCGSVVPVLLLLPHFKALSVKHSLCFIFLWVAEDRDGQLHFRCLVKHLDNIVNGFFSTTRAAVSPMDELRNTQTLQN